MAKILLSCSEVNCKPTNRAQLLEKTENYKKITRSMLSAPWILRNLPRRTSCGDFPCLRSSLALHRLIPSKYKSYLPVSNKTSKQTFTYFLVAKEEIRVRVEVDCLNEMDEKGSFNACFALPSSMQQEGLRALCTQFES